MVPIHMCAYGLCVRHALYAGCPAMLSGLMAAERHVVNSDVCCRTVSKLYSCSVAKSYDCSVSKPYSCSVPSLMTAAFPNLTAAVCQVLWLQRFQTLRLQCCQVLWLQRFQTLWHIHMPRVVTWHRMSGACMHHLVICKCMVHACRMHIIFTEHAAYIQRLEL